MSEKRVEALGRALTLLEAFNAEKKELSLAELSKVTGYYKSTILRLMATLEFFGYVVRDEKGIFRIGPAVLRLASLATEDFPAEKLIRPILQSLSKISGETASFYIREGNERVCRFREEGQYEVRHHLVEGTRLPLNAGAAGHILSGETHDHRAIISVGEREPSLAAAAVGIFLSSGTLLGAIALSGPKDRFTLSADRYQTLLSEKAQELEAKLPHGSLII